MKVTIFSDTFRGAALAFVLIMIAGISNVALAQRSEGTYLIQSSDTMIGIAPGQTLRLTFFNPTSNTIAGPHVRVFNGSGDSLIDARHRPLAAGEFDSFDIRYSDIEQIAGEGGTGRRQIRTDISIVYTGLESEAKLFRPTWEMVDSVNGQSVLIGLLLPAVQKVR